MKKTILIYFITLSAIAQSNYQVTQRLLENPTGLPYVRTELVDNSDFPVLWEEVFLKDTIRGQLADAKNRYTEGKARLEKDKDDKLEDLKIENDNYYVSEVPHLSFDGKRMVKIQIISKITGGGIMYDDIAETDTARISRVKDLFKIGEMALEHKNQQKALNPTDDSAKALFEDNIAKEALPAELEELTPTKTEYQRTEVNPLLRTFNPFTDIGLPYVIVEYATGRVIKKGLTNRKMFDDVPNTNMYFIKVQGRRWYKTGLPKKYTKKEFDEAFDEAEEAFNKIHK